MSKEQSKKDWKKVRDKHEAQNEQEKAKEANESQPDPDIDDLIDEIEHPDKGSGSLEHASYKELEEQLTQAEQKAHENWEKSVRAMAELDNVRRRAQRDVEHAHRFGLEKFIDSLLPIVDSLEQALNLASEQDVQQSMQEGLELTMKLFLDALKKHGVEQLNPEGEIFDPQVHEAMSMQESKDAKPNTILTVFQRGYKLNDRVIRPARVVVAKGK